MTIPQDGPLSLRVNFSWTFAGNVIYAACQWGMLVALAKFTTPEQVGQFSLGLAITTPIILFSNLNLRIIQSTDIRDEYSFGSYFGLRILATMCALLVIIGLAFVGGYTYDTVLVILVIGLAKAVESISDLFYGFLQRRERMDKIGKSLTVRGLLSVIGFGASVYITHSVVVGSIVLAIMWVVTLVAYDIPNSLALFSEPSDLNPEWSSSVLKSLIVISMPLGIGTLFSTLADSVPRYFLQASYSSSEVGIYSALAYLTMAGSLVINALGQSVRPRLATLYTRAQYRDFLWTVARMCLIGVGVAGLGLIVIMLAGRLLLTLIYDEAYASHTNVLIWLMVAAGLNYTYIFLSSAISAMRRFVTITYVTIFNCIVGLALSWMLIPQYGLLGAAWAVIGDAAFSLIAFLIIAIVYYHREFSGRLLAERGSTR